MRVLGIDPGLRNMGWGVIEVAGSRISHVANGVCRSSGDDMAARLGTVRDVVGRALRSLAADGIIEFDRHQIVILDIDRLTEEADI